MAGFIHIRGKCDRSWTQTIHYNTSIKHFEWNEPSIISIERIKQQNVKKI